MTDEMFVVPARKDVARFFGVADSTVKSWRADGMPGDAGQWNLKLIFEWWLARNSGDVSPSSPALEKQREYKAALLKLDLLRRQGQLLDRGEVHSCLAWLASILRGCGDMLGRQFGPDAQALLNEHIEIFDRRISEELDGEAGDSEPADDSQPAAAVANIA